MSAKPRDLGMTPLDDLFSTDESRAEAQLEKVVTLNLAEISDFPNHPFKVKQDEAMAEMVDSVKRYGVLVPALVRPKADGGYEMVAGHRRKCAATLAGITEMPCMHNELRDTPKTGDDNNPALWLALLGVSAAGAAALGVVGFRKRRKEGAE